MNALQKIRQVCDDMPKVLGPKQTNEAWALVGRLLDRIPGDREEAARIVNDRDLEALDTFIHNLEHPEDAPEPARTAQAKPDTSSVSKDDMDAAMRAFRKRLKLTRLNDESKLGGRYTSGGKKSQIDAIEAPREFPPEVWQALADTGKLTDTGRGFYALPRH